MTIYEFQLRMTFIQFEDKEQNLGIYFFPLSNGKETGAMNTKFPDGKTLGGEYTLKYENLNLYISWNDASFLLRPTELGFDLISSPDTVTYSFTRPVV